MPAPDWDLGDVQCYRSMGFPQDIPTAGLLEPQPFRNFSRNESVMWRLEWECPDRPILLYFPFPVGRAVWEVLGNAALLVEAAIPVPHLPACLLYPLPWWFLALKDCKPHINSFFISCLGHGVLIQQRQETKTLVMWSLCKQLVLHKGEVSCGDF